MDYTLANSWPDDAKDVDEDVYLEYAGEPPTGKRRVVDNFGMPGWADVPVDYAGKAEAKRQNLLSVANEIINDWRTELQLDVISDEDKANLILWMAYIKELKSLTFDDINSQEDFEAVNWPVSPK